MSVELMLNAANMTLVTFARMWGDLSAHTFALIAIASVAAACALSGFMLYVMFQSSTPGAPGGLPYWKVGGIDQQVYTWIEVGKLKVELAFRLDTLSAVMITIVTFVGTLIHIYS